MIKNFAIFTFILCSFVFNTFALENSVNLVELEGDIENNIRRKVTHFAKKKDVIISVKVIKKITSKVIRDTKKKTKSKKFNISPLAKFDLYDIQDSTILKTIKKDKITRIEAQIYFSDSLKKETQESIKSILTETLPLIGTHEMRYSFHNFTPAALPKPKEKRKVPLYEKYINLISLTIFGFITILIIFFGISKFHKVALMLIKALEGLKPEAELTSTIESFSTVTNIGGGSGDNSTTSSESSSAGESHDFMEVMMTKPEGVKRFLTYLEQSPSDAANLIRSWKNENTVQSLNAISLTLKALDMNELKEFMLEFTSFEKKELRKLILKTSMNGNYKEVDKYILEKLVNLVIQPSYVQDADFNKSLYSTNVAQLVHIAKGDPELGSELLAVLPENISMKICKTLDNETFTNIMSCSLDFSPEKLQNNYNKLKFALDTAKSQELKELSPIFNNTVMLLKTATSEKEAVIIDILSKIKNKEDFIEIMMDNYPSQLFTSLPTETIKATLLSMKVKDTVNYLITIEETERLSILDNIAQLGSKSRDIYDLEIAKILENAAQLDTINQKKLSVQAIYTHALREKVKVGRYREKAYSILKAWVESKYDENNIKLVS